MAKIRVTLSDGRQVDAPSKEVADLLVQLDQEAVQARAAASQGKRDSAVTCKFNPIGAALPSGGTGKGNIGIYGMGRFPVTLYAGQWPKLAAELPIIAGLILRHKDELAWRDDASKATTIAWAETVAAKPEPVQTQETTENDAQ